MLTHSHARTRFALVLTLLLLAGKSSASTDTLTIWHINDTHSCIAPTAPRGSDLQATRGGIARVATVVGQSRMTDPNVIFVHAGDFMIGDLVFNATFGVSELRMLQAMGLDALALGNHEFDLGPSVLASVLDSLKATGTTVSVLSSNLYIPDELSDLRSSVATTSIRQYGNVKVGFFALTTPDANMLSQPGPAVLDTGITAIATASVAALHEAGCQVVICLSHLGYNPDLKLAQAVTGITVIISAHDHWLKPATPVAHGSDTTWIQQANAFYWDIGKLQLRVSDGIVSLLNAEILPLDASIPEEPTIKAAVDQVMAYVESIYGPVYTQKIAEATADFDEVPTNVLHKGPHDTPVGNLMADAERAAFGTDVGIVPGGSSAQPIFHGPIVADDLYRTISYGFNTYNGLDYHLATFTMTGEAMAAGLEFGLANVEYFDEFLSQVSGMSYTYDPRQPAFSRLQGVLVHGEPLDPAKTYTVASNEFVPAILAVLNIPISDLHVYAGDTTEFQVISSYVQHLGSISPIQEGRVTASETMAVPTRSATASILAVHLYPNPARGASSLSFCAPANSHLTVSLYSMDAREILSFGVVADGSTQSVGLPVSGLAAGVYIVKVDDGRRPQAVPLVIN